MDCRLQRPTPRWPARVGAAALAFAATAAPALAAELTDDLKVFGHLTVAYGESGRGTILGISESGTTELSKIAVQFRWDISERDRAVVQLAHERNGDDLFFPQDGEVRVDWAFYERLLGAHTSLKLGRLNLPLGIYNEVRDVGTLLPFFALPISFYAGVLSSAETVDGASICVMVAPRSDWDLELNLHYGGWDTAQQRVDPRSRFGLETLEARAEDGFGAQLWLSTPFQGVRFGVGALTWLLEGPLTPAGTKERWKSYHLSLDASRDRWLLRAELRRWRFDQNAGGFLGLDVPVFSSAERDGFYAQAGVWITPEWGLFAQYQEMQLREDSGLIPVPEDFHDEVALSLNYRPRPDLVARVEYHTSDTRFPLGELQLGPSAGAPPVPVDWVIVALSVSF